VAFGDWGEMQVQPTILGIAHPTGYPTYLLIAHFTELVPIGSVAFRANVLSAVLVALALATVVLIEVRLGVRPILAAAAALALGAVGTVWAAATVAEVNPLHLLFAALILHRVLVWAEHQRVRDLALGGLLIGLSLGNHLLTMVIAPFIALFVLWTGRRAFATRPALLLVPLAGLAIGLSVYLYVPIRAAQNPPLAYNHPTTLDAVFWLITGQQFHGQFDFLSLRGPGELLAALPNLVDLADARATLVLPIVGLVGLVVLALRRPAVAALFVGLLVVGVYVWANYLRLEHYLLVPWLLVGVASGVWLEAIARSVAERLPASGPLVAPAAVASTGVATAAIVFAVVLGLTNGRAADLSSDHEGDIYVASVMDGLPRDAVILSQWDTSTPLWYGQLVEGERPDVLVIDDTNIVYEGWVTRERAIAAYVCKRPVFMLRLDDRDLVPTRAAYRVTPFIDVRVAYGGPTAVADRTIYRVEALPSGCTG
jgi:transmembrane protein TMEM260 (protein O-mannosyltransferase)